MGALRFVSLVFRERVSLEIHLLLVDDLRMLVSIPDGLVLDPNVDVLLRLYIGFGNDVVFRTKRWMDGTNVGRLDRRKGFQLVPLPVHGCFLFFVPVVEIKNTQEERTTSSIET